jgi:hypothetical protein
MAVKKREQKVASTIQDNGQTKFSDHLSLLALECRHHLELA